MQIAAAVRGPNVTLFDAATRLASDSQDENHGSTMRTETVRKLAGTARSRRNPDAAFVCLLIAVLAAAAAKASEWHPTDDIARVAESFLVSKLGRPAADTSVRAGMLDRRLKLSVCDRPLEGFLRTGTRIGAKTIVGVRCDGTRPWKVYVPVEVEVRKRVWVARQPLPRGHLLAREDLAADVRDVSRMTSGYLSDPEALVGRRLRSSVLAGRVLTPNLLEANNIISRGQTVTLMVASGDLQIRMAGKALMDGALNERIRVENLNSGRVVEGIVRSSELVEILVPTAGNFLPQAPKVSAVSVDTGYSNNDR